MKYIVMLTGCLALLLGCERDEPAELAGQVETGNTAGMMEQPADTFDEAAQIKKAKKAIQLFAGALQAEFGAAMQTDGPAVAIHVCNTEAKVIADRISAEQGLQLGRVSLKNRSPANAPKDWQTPVLLEFEKRHAEGENLAYISWSEVAGEGADREFRFMKPIPTHSLCLSCHGNNLAPDVRDILVQLYPDDLATGFSEGDIRGAFVVISKPEG
jgi:hypothetical protein